MANQGLLAQIKPSANTDTVLYRAPIDQSASTVLNIANDGTGSAYDVALKDCDQQLTLDAATYKLHQGDIISSYFVTLNTNMTNNTDISVGQSIATTDLEKSFKFESFYAPALTTKFVKAISVRQIPLESITGAFVVGDTFTKGTGGDTATATVFGVDDQLVIIGVTTLAGTGSEFVAGDSVTGTGGGAATISASPAITTAKEEFCFSDTSGGVYNMHTGTDQLEIQDDRSYRFDVSDSSMSGRDFKLSEVANGEYGPDGDASTAGDNGTEYTTGKTTNGTAGSSGAYVQFAFGDSVTPDPLYFYDGGTGTASNSGYGGQERSIEMSDEYTYTGFYIYDKVGTLTDNVDTFLVDGVTYTITAQTTGAYGYVKDYTGSVLKFVKGIGSADFSGSDTFRDVPKLNTGIRTVATVSSVTVASAAVEASNYLVDGLTNGNNEVDKITSLVIGPGEVLVVKTVTDNNLFSLVGFEDSSDSITTRVFGQS